MANLLPVRSTDKHEREPNPLLEAALCYARTGWQVLPLYAPTPTGCDCPSRDCKSIGKHPRLTNGVKGASADEDLIRSWWANWPEANIGIATGSRSRLLVLDIDGEQGRRALERLEEPQPLPQTLRCLTGRRGSDNVRAGHHLYFSVPAGSDIRNSAGKLGLGLDVRGEGGYIVAPPSIHASGISYRWEQPFQPAAQAPTWLLAKLSVADRSPLGLGMLYQGERHQTLFRLAAKLHHAGASRDQIEQQIRGANARRCKPPLSGEEVWNVVSSADKLLPLGPDALELAWMLAEADEPTSLYAALVLLACHLQEKQPGTPILLPVERVATLMRCHRTLVGRYRLRAIKDGFIEEVGRYVAHQTAKRYRVHSTAMLARHSLTKGVSLIESLNT